MPARVLFRGANYRFVSPRDRDKAVFVDVRRRGAYVPVISGDFTETELATVLSRDEYESLPEMADLVAEIKPRARKYRLWDAAEKIDALKGIRRKFIRIDIEIEDGKRLRKQSVYTRIKANQKRSYQIFKQMREGLLGKKMFEYDKAPGKIMVDAKGKRVRVKNVKVSVIR